MRPAVLALVLVAALAVAGVAYVAVPRVRAEVDAVKSGAGWTFDMWSAINSQLPHLSVQSKAIVLAHAALESGFGNGRAAKRGFNVFNLTAGKYWTGESWSDVGGDTEYDAAGNVKVIDQRWRIYSSLEVAVNDYWAFIGTPRYLPARTALEAGDVADFVGKLYAGGYFTLPPTEYLRRLSGVLSQVQEVIG